MFNRLFFILLGVGIMALSSLVLVAGSALADEARQNREHDFSQFTGLWDSKKGTQICVVGLENGMVVYTHVNSRTWGTKFKSWEVFQLTPISSSKTYRSVVEHLMDASVYSNDSDWAGHLNNFYNLIVNARNFEIYEEQKDMISIFYEGVRVFPGSSGYLYSKSYYLLNDQLVVVGEKLQNGFPDASWSEIQEVTLVKTSDQCNGYP